MNTLFAVVMKVLDGKNKGKLVTTKMFGESENQLKDLISSCGLQPIVVSKEW